MDLSNQVDRHNNNNRTMHVITSSEVWDGIKIGHHDAHNIIMLTGVRLHGNPRSLNRDIIWKSRKCMVYRFRYFRGPHFSLHEILYSENPSFRDQCIKWSYSQFMARSP